MQPQVVPHNSACTGHWNPDSVNVRNVTKSLKYFLLFLFWFVLHSCKDHLMFKRVMKWCVCLRLYTLSLTS